MTDISRLSGPKLLALIDARQEAARDATANAIANGLGNVRFSEMRTLAGEGNPIARTVVETWDAESEAKAELQMRRNYHGTDGPIRRVA